MPRSALFLLLAAATLPACQDKLASPAPSLAGVDPQLVCNDQKVTTVTVSGDGLTPLPTGTLTDGTALDLPGLSLTRTSDLTGGAASDAAIDLDDSADGGIVRWDSAQQMAFDVGPDLALAAGVYDLGVANADGQTASLAGALAVADAPTLTAVDPPIFCGQQAPTTITLTGTGFLQVDATLPTVTIGTDTYTADAVDGCSALAGPVSGQICTSLTVTVPADSLPAGVYDVKVTNPAPADCVSTEATHVQVVDAPVITDLVPPDLCVDGGDTAMTVEGTGFLQIDGAEPSVAIDGDVYAIDSMGGCSDLGGPVTGQVCTSVVVTVPGGKYALGTHSLSVTNPPPADCTTSEPADFDVLPPPTIDDIVPDSICDSGGSFVISGSGFVDGAVVDVDGVTASSVTVVSQSEIDVVMPGGLTVGFHAVTVTNPGGCAVTDPVGIQVVPAPLLFYVDPPVAYNGIALDATLYVSGVTGTITDVSITDTSTGTTTSLAYDASNPDQISATIPAGLPEGDYTVSILQDDTCPSYLDSGLHVEADLTVAIDGVDPEFAWTGGYTPVTITATDPAPSGSEQFQDVPRVYLNPTSSASATATPLVSVSYSDATHLDAVIPAGLDVDTYDVIVVNPDGAVGLLAGGLQVTADPPPSVDSISPPSISDSTTGPVTVYGADFRSPTVDFECTDPTTGTVTTGSGKVTASDATSITVDVPTSTLGDGVCVLRVTNSDGTWIEYSAMSITNPAQNLYAWSAGTSMTTARRAPSAVAGRATTTARYLYAIGGDSGAASGAYDSIEYASVDKYGAMGTWALLPGTLPAARTLSSVQIVDRFVYLVGGNDGTAPVSTVLRAQVLDPLDVPYFDDLTIDYGTGVEMGPGTWSYRVAALFDASYATNPGGESLAGDPIVVRLPDIPDRIVLTIAWTPVANASGYRVYRTPTADAGSGTEEWLADVSGGSTVTFTDDGSATDPSVVPLPKGALGEWATVATLKHAAQSPCTAKAVDPADATKEYLYVAGGLDASSKAWSDVEIVPITIGSDGSQSVGTVTTSAEALGAGVYECAGWSADPALNSVVPAGETWLYFGGGRTSSSTTTGDIYAGEVDAGGDFVSGTWSNVDVMNPTRAGFGYAIASNFLYVFGGQKGAPSNGGKSSEIIGPPDLDNWNALGTSLTEDRYLMGSAQESSVIYMVGGQTTTASATASTDQTNY